MKPLKSGGFLDPVAVFLFTVQEDDAPCSGAYGIISEADAELGKSTGIQAAEMYIIKILPGEIRGGMKVNSLPVKDSGFVFSWFQFLIIHSSSRNEL